MDYYDLIPVIEDWPQPFRFVGLWVWTILLVSSGFVFVVGLALAIRWLLP